MPANGRWDLIRRLKCQWSVLLTQYFLVDEIEKNEMGGECGTYDGEERRIQGFSG
jgi:hypothetical protein